MPILRIDLDAHSFERLAESAFRELRPVNWQAEVLIRRALGLLAPVPLVSAHPRDDDNEVARGECYTARCYSGQYAKGVYDKPPA
jgi:hypothetical protein